MIRRLTPRDLVASHAGETIIRSFKIGGAIFGSYLALCISFVVGDLPSAPLYYAGWLLSHPFWAGLGLALTWWATLWHRANALINGTRSWENLPTFFGGYIVADAMFATISMLIEHFRPYCGGF